MILITSEYIFLLPSWGIEPSPGGITSSPGGDASPRRHLLGKARCLDKQIQYIFSLPSWGIEPQLGNTDAGTRHPQVRTRFLLVMKKINDRLMKKINDRLMMINVQKKGSRSEPYLILSYFVHLRFTGFRYPMIG